MAWPRDTEADLIAFYGDPAREAVAPQLVKVIPPFRMTYDGTPLSHLMFHRLAAPALERALQRVWDYYGRDQARVDALGISKTAGTYNKRKISGSSRWSNHAFGAAIDINAAENGFNMAGNIPIPMVAAFKAEGARWGGDYKGRTDPMHFEFCASGEPARTFEQWLAHYGVTQTAGVSMPSNFDRVHPLIAKWEGGYSNDPADPGGPTNFGITQDRLSEARGRQVSAAEVKAMPYAEALDIFKRYYWTPLRCDELPIALAIMTYNTGVNSGPSRGARFLQQVLNRQGAGLDEDGEIGPLTINAARECKDVAQAVRDYAAIYESYYRSLPTFPRFGDGWLNRLNDITPQALALAQEKPPVADTPASPNLGAEFLQQMQALQAQISALTATIGTLLNTIRGATLPPVVDPEPPVVVAPPAQPPTTPILQNPGVQLGGVGALLTAVLTSLGTIDPTAPGTVGQLLPIASAGSALLGASGTFGTVLNILSTVGRVIGRLSGGTTAAK